MNVFQSLMTVGCLVRAHGHHGVVLVMLALFIALPLDMMFFIALAKWVGFVLTTVFG